MAKKSGAALWRRSLLHRRSASTTAKTSRRTRIYARARAGIKISSVAGPRHVPRCCRQLIVLFCQPSRVLLRPASSQAVLPSTNAAAHFRAEPGAIKKHERRKETRRPAKTLYSSSSARSLALALVTRTFSCAARSTISLRLRAETSCAISAQYLRLCINKSSSSATLFTRNL